MRAAGIIREGLLGAVVAFLPTEERSAGDVEVIQCILQTVAEEKE